MVTEITSYQQLFMKRANSYHMGLADAITKKILPSCLECGHNQILKESSSFNTADRYYCDECGHEPEREVLVNALNGSASNGDTTGGNHVYVCRECHEGVSPDVQRCPHCGWKPEKSGLLWWVITVILGLTPIGWAMGAKGVSNDFKSMRGVAKKLNKKKKATENKPREDNSKSPTDLLHELEELKEEGAISKEEYRKKKIELLEIMNKQ